MILQLKIKKKKQRMVQQGSRITEIRTYLYFQSMTDSSLISDRKISKEKYSSIALRETFVVKTH